MMAAASADMNVTIISMNVDILEQQRGHMHRAVDHYVDKVIAIGRQWITRGERNHSTFLEIQTITSKAMAFLSLKCQEMKSDLESETSDLIGKDEFTQQQKHTQMDSAGKPAITQRKSKEDDTHDVKETHTFTNPNLESDQQTRYQEVYNQLKSVLAKQDKLEQQLNIKLNSLREDTDRLKSDVGTFNQYVDTGKTLLKDYSQKLESLENTVSCLSGRVNELYTDQQVLVDRINSHVPDKDYHVIKDLSDKVDHVNRDLSVKIDQINTQLSDKVGEINIDLPAKVDQIHTDLSGKVDQINVVLQSLTNSEKEHAEQIKKIIDLENHFNTIEKDTQNNDKQVQQRLDEVGGNLLDVIQKLTDLSVNVATTCAKKSDLGAVGLCAATNLQSSDEALSVVGKFGPVKFIAGCQFNPRTGIFIATSEGFYLVYLRMFLYNDSHSCVSLIRQYTEFDETKGQYQKETEICIIQTERKNSTVCNLDIITMREGDKLFIRTSKQPVAKCNIKLLCFRIG